MQVELARLPDHGPARPALEDREHDLLAAHEPAWLGVPSDALTEWEWDRGFVNEVRCGADTLLEHGPDLFSRHPVRGWDPSATWAPVESLVAALRGWASVIEVLDLQAVSVHAADFDRLLTGPDWPRLSRLVMSDRRQFDWLVPVFARCTFAPRLRLLRAMSGPNSDGDDFRLARLTEATAGTRLADLGVPGCRATARELSDLLARSASDALDRLDLSDSDLAATAVRAFHRTAARLTALDVSGTPLAAFALEPLLAAPALAGLRELNVNRCGSAANAVRALLRSPFWSQATALRLADGTVPTRLVEPLFAADGPPALRTLDLSNNFLYDAGVADLCNATWAGSLTWLGLGRNYLTDDAAEHIARSGRFRHLRTLHLSYNHPRWLDEDFAGQVTDRGAVALATSPGLATLRVLTLTGVNLTAAGVDALVNGAVWRLSGLGLGHCNLTAAAVRVLAASPRLARLSFLDLSGNPRLRDDALLPLAESPYLSPLLELDVHGCGAADGVRAELSRRLGRRFGG